MRGGGRSQVLNEYKGTLKRMTFEYKAEHPRKISIWRRLFRRRMSTGALIKRDTPIVAELRAAVAEEKVPPPEE